jgi:hypothetical protein
MLPDQFKLFFSGYVYLKRFNFFVHFIVGKKQFTLEEAYCFRLIFLLQDGSYSACFYTGNKLNLAT